MEHLLRKLKLVHTKPFFPRANPEVQQKTLQTYEDAWLQFGGPTGRRLNLVDINAIGTTELEKIMADKAKEDEQLFGNLGRNRFQRSGRTIFHFNQHAWTLLCREWFSTTTDAFWIQVAVPGSPHNLDAAAYFSKKRNEWLQLKRNHSPIPSRELDRRAIACDTAILLIMSLDA